MQLKTKRFDELSLDELYAILRLRVNVFVVEQCCPYPELDDRDQQALHVWLEDDEGIEAYLRVLDRGITGPHAAIGRVIAVKRRAGLGTKIVQAGIDTARERSADIYSQATEIFKIINSEYQNAQLLLKNTEKTALLADLLNRSEIPTRIVHGLVLEDKRRRQPLTDYIQIFDGSDYIYMNL